MLCRTALLALLGAVSACNAPPDKEPPQPAVQEAPPPPAPTAQQIAERSEQCGKTSGEQFRRDWRAGGRSAADAQADAEFSYHYNAKLDTCFYLLTVKRSADVVNMMIFDINDGEQYGEYLGPAEAGSQTSGLPAACRIESIYCASRREWEVLVSSFMED